MQKKKNLITYTAVNSLQVILKSQGLILNSIGIYCAPGHIDVEVRFLESFLYEVNESNSQIKVLVLTLFNDT